MFNTKERNIRPCPTILKDLSIPLLLVHRPLQRAGQGCGLLRGTAVAVACQCDRFDRHGAQDGGLGIVELVALVRLHGDGEERHRFHRSSEFPFHS